MDVDAEYVQSILVKSGWSEIYHSDIACIIECYNQYRFQPNKEVLKFLYDFSGLRFTYFNELSKREYVACNINPCEFDDYYEYYFYEKLNDAVNMQFFPIGMAYNQNMLLMVDENVRFYAHYEQGVWYVGGDFYEALIALHQPSTNLKQVLRLRAHGLIEILDTILFRNKNP